MMLEEYISEVMQAVDVSETTKGRIRNQLETELFQMIEAGKTPEEAMNKMGYYEEVAAKLMQQYDDDVRKKQEGDGQPPMIFAWGAMFSVLLFVIKGLQYFLLGHKQFDALGMIVGFLGVIASGIYLLWFIKNKKKRS